jgi:hypothetical protein
VRGTALAALAPRVDPPADLRLRVLAGVGIHPHFKWNWMQTWATVAAGVVAALFWADHLRRERVRDVAFHDAMQQVKLADAESSRVKELLALLNAPETIVRVTSEGAAKPPKAKVFFNRSRGVLLLASDLPPAPAGKRYEMWVIPSAGNPVPAGLFQTEANGTAAHLRKGPLDLDATAAVAVTLEDEAGAPQPTSQPILVAKR